MSNSEKVLSNKSKIKDSLPIFNCSEHKQLFISLLSIVT